MIRVYFYIHKGLAQSLLPLEVNLIALPPKIKNVLTSIIIIIIIVIIVILLLLNNKTIFVLNLSIVVFPDSSNITSQMYELIVSST
mgnify:CR=1 FL=1